MRVLVNAYIHITSKKKTFVLCKTYETYYLMRFTTNVILKHYSQKLGNGYTYMHYASAFFNLNIVCIY